MVRAVKDTDKIQSQVTRALKRGKCLIVVWKLEGGKRTMTRYTDCWPHEETEGSVEQLVADLDRERGEE